MMIQGITSVMRQLVLRHAVHTGLAQTAQNIAKNKMELTDIIYVTKQLASRFAIPTGLE
jgi:galactitol-specific phosphotransferase system IIB component